MPEHMRPHLAAEQRREPQAHDAEHRPAFEGLARPLVVACRDDPRLQSNEAAHEHVGRGRVPDERGARVGEVLAEDRGERYFVHRADVEDYPSLLERGERVSFVPTAEAKGPRARHVWRAASAAPRTTLGEAARWR